MSFLSRLLLLVLLAVLVPVAILGFNELDTRRQRQVELSRFAAFHADAVASELEQIIAGIRQMLIAISTAPVITRLDLPLCAAYLSELQKRDGRGLQIGILDDRGNVVCRAEGVPPTPIDNSDRAHFQLARDTRDFSIGDYTVGRFTGQRAIHLSYPILSRDGAFRGVVTLPLSVDWLAQHLKSKIPADGSSITIIDRDGTILVDLPRGARVGEQLQLAQLPKPGESADLLSPVDGERRIMGIAAVDAAEGARVAVGVARDVAFAELDRAAERLIALILIALGLSLVAAWLVGRYGLQRPIFLLNDAVRRWAAGDYSARTRLSGRSELDRLGQTFDRMADALEARDRERAGYEEQLRQSRDDAVEANAAKSRFLASASHDLRQPLQALSMGVTVLEERHRGDQQELVMIARIKRSLTSLTDLLNSLLDIAALEAGAVNAQMQDFPLGSLLRTLLDDYAQQAAAKGLRYRVGECDTVVRSDPQHLGRMLRNLVDNAIKFTPAGGEVSVACSTGDASVEIEVSDTGIGVSAEEQRRIFQDFSQLHNPERSRSKGLGLGLAVVERMSRLLQHPVRVESAPGAGAKFVIRVPRAAGTPALKEPSPAGVSRGRVLLVEDDPLVAEATEALLASWGAKVQLARTAEEALSIIGRDAQGFDIVIADYRLPSSSGLEVVANAILKWPRIKAAIVTGDRESVSHEKIISTGVHLLEKPIRARQLAELVGAPSSERAGPG
jgi:two-component system, sensor histidine kinase